RCSCVFVQAEDGIRDDLVTGVQTCALPISVHRRFGQGAAPRLAGSAVGKTVGEGSTRSGQRRHRQSGSGTRPANCRRAARTPRRSEERRVGKEQRAGSSPYGGSQRAAPWIL